MSKHGFWGVKAIIIAMAALLSVLLPPSGFAKVPAAIEITVEDRQNIMAGQYFWTDISIYNNSGIELAGFDLLIEYDVSGLDFAEALPGQILNDCGWEYFNYRNDAGALRIVALADLAGGIDPDCLIGNTSGSIVELAFHVRDDPSLNCINLPIRFLWRDCADNAFTNSTGTTLYLSRYVYDWEFHDPIHENDTFPTYKGAPDSCFNIPAPVQPVRKVDFTSGRIEIMCSDSIDQRGDINLNDIPYEIADYVLFEQYFLSGLSAFTINLEKQIAATEINNDGIALTLRDLIYLWRVIIGDALPFPKKAARESSDTAIFIQDTDGNTVRFFYPDTLAAAYMIFSGDIQPQYTGACQFAYEFDGIHTNVLITPSPTDPRQGFTEGFLFTYNGSGTLDSLEIADFYDNLIPTEIRITQGVPACGDVNADGETNNADIIHLINYIFLNGPEPYSLSVGDVNCDDKINLADVIYMAGFIFRGGPIPCAGCPR